ncbi:MAG: hypothetical protein C4293_21770 [Nitrospiraceae bacterium]|mgnify:CR=1 FL=1
MDLMSSLIDAILALSGAVTVLGMGLWMVTSQEPQTTSSSSSISASPEEYGSASEKRSRAA